MKKKPVVVCLCGSTRFKEAYIDAAKTETLAGKIVLSVGLFGHQEGIDMAGPVKQMLDELHLRKIDLADEVLVLNPVMPWCPSCGMHCQEDHGRSCCCDEQVDVNHGYIGASTRREIEYATKAGKTIRYLTERHG
jgi:hypothetical protein